MIDDIFYKIKDHLLTQNERAWQEGGCVYRDDKGRKCAVGVLISDDVYHPEMEGNCVWEIIDELRASGIQIEQGYPSEPIYVLLDRAQSIHDEVEPEDWPEHLDKLAKEFGITERR